jgi:hypothetical protein
MRWPGKIVPNSPYYMNNEPNATYNAAGINRIERLKTLHANFQENGVTAELEIVPDVGHNERRIFPTMREFFIKSIPLHPNEDDSETSKED